MERSWEGKTVLIVDDSKNVRSELNELYLKAGMQVVGLAASGQTALEMIREKNPDLVSLDIIMPEMDGIECFRKAVEEEGSEKREFLFITALASEEKVTGVYKDEIGVNRFMTKPPTLQNLENKLRLIFP